MKKITLFAIAIIMATAATAQVNRVSELKSFAQSLDKVFSNKQAKTSVKAEEDATFDTPEGTLYDNLYVTSFAFGLSWGDFYTQNVDGGLGAVVEGADGNLYIYAPISQTYIWFSQLPWLKAEKNAEGNYVMKTPQLYVYDAGDPYYAYRLKYDENEGKCVVDEENTEITFSWQDGVLTQLDDCYIGLCDETGEWFYMADCNIVYKPQADQVNLAPEGIEERSYNMTYRNKASDETSTKERMVSVYIDGSDIYLGNINDNTPDGCMKGTLENGKATFPAKQYLGPDVYYGGHAYALTGNAFIDGDEDSQYFNYNLTGGITFDVDEELKTLTAAYPASIVTNIGPNNLYIINDYVAPVLNFVDDKAATPADPIFTAADMGKFSESAGLGRMSFEIVLEDTEGNKINENKVFYNIYLDDQPMTFTTDVYVGLTEDMTDVPYKFQDNNNFDIYINDTKHIVYYYTNDFQKIGVQTIYRAGGEEHRSQIVYVTKDDMGINNVTATSADNRWYTISGQRVDKPTVKGIYINGGRKVIIK